MEMLESYSTYIYFLNGGVKKNLKIIHNMSEAFDVQNISLFHFKGQKIEAKNLFIKKQTN